MGELSRQFSPQDQVVSNPRIFLRVRVAGQFAIKVEFSQMGRVWDELGGELARAAILPTNPEYRFKRPKLRFDQKWLN